MNTEAHGRTPGNPSLRPEKEQVLVQVHDEEQDKDKEEEEVEEFFLYKTAVLPEKKS